MIIILVCSILLNIVLAYLVYINYIKYEKALKYTEAYVLFVSSLWFKFNDTKNRMEELDTIGAFRSDDQVGHTFDSLKECIDNLYEFITKYVNKQDTKKD